MKFTRHASSIRPEWAVVLILCTASGCKSARLTAPESPPPAIPTNPTAPKSKKSGWIGIGFLATFYDRDGDGRYEECVRGNTRYFDRNGDGVEDFRERFDGGTWFERRDENFDGVLDSETTMQQPTGGRRMARN